MDISSEIVAVRTAAAATLAAMAEVGTVVGKMNEVTGAIAAAVEQQTITTQALATHVQAVSGATDQAVRSM